MNGLAYTACVGIGKDTHARLSPRTSITKKANRERAQPFLLGQDERETGLENFWQGGEEALLLGRRVCVYVPKDSTRGVDLRLESIECARGETAIAV